MHNQADQTCAHVPDRSRLPWQGHEPLDLSVQGNRNVHPENVHEACGWHGKFAPSVDRDFRGDGWLKAPCAPVPPTPFQAYHQRCSHP